MTEFMNGFEQMLSVVIEFSIHLLEFMGVATILVGAVRAVYELFRHNPGVRLKLAESMALALEFKLGGEILRTVQVRDWSEIAIVGAIILLRGVLNLLIHHEIRVEEERDERLKHMSESEHGEHGGDQQHFEHHRRPGQLPAGVYRDGQDVGIHVCKFAVFAGHVCHGERGEHDTDGRGHAGEQALRGDGRAEDCAPL